MHKQHKLTTLLFIFSLGMSMISCDPQKDHHNPEITLQTILDKYTKGNRLPGVILFIKEPGTSYYLASGKTDLTSGDKMKTSSRSYPQSISKSFTAVSILKLQEAGLLDIDDLMNVYLPVEVCNQLAHGNEITIRQLLNHATGIKNYLDVPRFREEVASGDAFPLTVDKVLSYVYNLPADFEPGSKFHYTDTNYHLLAMIIDEVTDTHHGYYFKNEIIEKLNLANTYYLPYESPEYYTGKWYSFNDDTDQYTDVTETQYKLTQGGIGADGLFCEAKDLGLYFTALFYDKTLLQESSLEEMKTNLVPGSAHRYGMG
ncbi:MAG TPA: serine hydrolase domain-containing protein, partial [Ohtaekwangia sp.]|nr:serine hydrolase domain-containing protein [Ohtaekwangia sp.]